MADTIIKRWNGTAWEEVNPQTTHTQIVASGTPSSTTYLRGDGTWSTVEAGSAFNGGTVSGNIEISNTLPKINLTDTNNNSDFHIANNNGTFEIADTTNQESRVQITSNGDVILPATGGLTLVDKPITNSSGALLWDGDEIYHEGHKPTLAELGAAASSHTHTIANVTGLQTALDGKAASSHTHSIANVTGLQTALDSKATPSDISTAVSNLVDSSPATLDTLNELAAALGDDPNFATTVSNNIGTKLSLSGGTMTGPLTMSDSGDPIYLNRIGSRGTEIYIGAGESLASITGGAEQVYIAGESGVSVHASSDNLTSGLNRSAQLIDTAGNASWGSGSITAGTFIGALSGNASTATNATKLATARNIAVSGAVTGNANFDGSGNITISTTATSDPTLTLSGDASGSATFTNLGNATLSVTVNDDSHNHIISNVDGLQGALDGKLSTSGKAADSNLLDGIDSSQFLRSDVSDTVAPGRTIQFYSNDVIDTGSGSQASLEVFQDTAGADAFMSFHVGGDYAAYFGLHGGINDFVVGGWSKGATYQRIYHDGYRPYADNAGSANSVAWANVTGKPTIGDITGVTAGSGLTGGGTSGTPTISHADTSSQASVNNSGRTYIQDITLDTYGHITGISSATETVVNTDTNYYLTGVSGSGNGTVTFTRQSLGNLTWSASHTHDDRYYTESEVNTLLAGKQAAGTYNTIIGTDTDLDTSGATIIDNIYVTDGVITSMGTRVLQASDINALQTASAPYYSPVANSLLVYNTTYGWLTQTVGYWQPLRTRSDATSLTSTGTNGTTGGSISAGVTLAQGDTIMMEVADSSAVSSGYTPNIVTFTLGSADTTPNSILQGVSYRTAYSTSTTSYMYHFKVGFSGSTLYFDDSFRITLLDTSTASSILGNTNAVLHVGRIWRLNQA